MNQHRGRRRAIAQLVVAISCLGSMASVSAPPAAAQFDGPSPIVTPSPLIEVGESGTIVLDGIPFYPTQFTIPEQLRIDAVLASSGTCVVDANLVSCAQAYDMEIQFTAIAPGNDVGILTRVDAMEAGVHFSRVEVDVVDPSIVADVHPQIVGPALSRVGIPITIHASVENSGTRTMADTVATFVIDPSLRVDTATWGEAGSCTLAAASVICAIGTTDPYSSTPITLDITPATVAAAGVSTMTVTSSSAQDAPDPFADSASITVEVIDEAVTDLGVEVEINPTSTVRVDMDLSLTFTNYGPTPLDTFQFELELIGDYYIAPGFYSVYGCDLAGLTVSCNGPAIGVGESRYFPIRAWPIDSGQPGTLTATVGSAYGERDPDPHPNTVTLDLPAPGPEEAVLTGSFTHDADARAMQSYFMNFVFTNHGPSHADDLMAIVTVPSTWIGSVYSSGGTTGYGSRCPEIAPSTYSCRSFGGRFVVGSNKNIRLHGFPLEPAIGDVVNVVVTTEESAGPNGPLTFTHAVDVAPAADPILTSSMIGSVRTTADVTGMSVFAFSDTDGFTPTATATVDSNKRYTFDALPAGRYRLAFVPPAGSGLATQWLGASPTRDGARTELAFGNRPNQMALLEVLQAEGTVSGTVTSSDATPLANVPVWVFATDNMWLPLATGTTSTDGRYSIGGLAAGNYQLYIPGAGTRPGIWFPGSASRRLAQEFTLAAGETRSDVDVMAVEAGTLSGRVTLADGSGLADVAVSTYAPGDRWVATYQAVTDADGNFELLVPPGDYRLLVKPPVGSGLGNQWYNDAPSRSAATPVTVTSGATTTITAVLA